MNKYYVVPANIIESYLSDDMESLLSQVAIVETDKDITEVAEILLDA